MLFFAGAVGEYVAQEAEGSFKGGSVGEGTNKISNFQSPISDLMRKKNFRKFFCGENHVKVLLIVAEHDIELRAVELYQLRL